MDLVVKNITSKNDALPWSSLMWLICVKTTWGGTKAKKFPEFLIKTLYLANPRKYS
jgi:hypothetical protein